MKKTISILVITLISIGFFAQTNTSVPVNVKSGTIFYPNNIEQYISSKDEEPLIENNYYKFVQFNQIPSQSTKEKMINAGMKFLEYIPMNTYLVSFPKGFNKAQLKTFGAISVMSITDKDRITQLASSTPYPSWAMEENKILLFLSFYDDLNFESCIEQINTANINIKTKNSFSHNVLISIDKSDIYSLLKYECIRLIDLTPEPGKPEHELSRNMHRSTMVNNKYAGGRKYDGSGVVVVDNDDGLVGPHIDFTGRMTQPGVTGNTGTHGDMTAGIIAGCGNLDPTMAGMATGCDIIIQNYRSTLPNTVTFHTRDSAVIFSSSYSNGCNAGYTSLARQVDREIRQNPHMIQVFSAGNSNNNNCGYGAGNQWGNITGGHKQAKNVIATANLESNMTLANSSSRGPADDGRIKPDIAAHGNGNYSTAPNNAYLRGSGTSAAAPSISGVMAQMYHAFKVNTGNRAESGLMKAIILNTAEDFGNVGPDFKFGWGRVHALRAIKTIETSRYLNSTVSTSGINSHQITVPANVKEVKVMVYWHDYEASTSASKSLVNNLDIKMELGASTFLPWILDPTPNATNLNTPATKGVDTLNNVEQVSIVNPTAGTYTLKVTGTSVPQGPQKYFVTYDFIYDDLTLVNPNGGEGYVPGITERIFWDAYGNSGNFTLKYSIDSGSTWNNIGTAGATSRFYDWTVPGVLSSKAMVKIERGTVSDESDHTFSIIRKPTNLTVTKVCPTYMEVSWTAVSGADQYQIYLLGNKFMDSVGRTTGTSFQIPITNPTDDQWFSVSAIKNNTQGNVGRRANAVYYAGGLLNCVLPTDAGVTAFLSPNNLNCSSGSTTIKVVVKNLGNSPISNVPVKYQINGGTIQSGTVTATINSLFVNNYSFATPYNFTTPGTYTVKAWTELTGDLYALNDTFELQYNYAPVSSIPFTENFNSFTNCSTDSDCEDIVCGLRNGFNNIENRVKDDIDWRTNSGTTPSNGTGPSGDHTSGFAKYLYIEASGSCYNKTAVLMSPCIDLGTTIATPFATFWYHMYGGTTLDSLTVDVYDGTNWHNGAFRIKGNQGNSWKKGLIDLTPYSGNIIKLRFNGTTGNNWNTDIALDDINISDHTSITENELANAIAVYPNPNNGEFNVSIENAKLEKVNMVIFDMYGRQVYQEQLSKKNNFIQLNSLASGVYTVRVSAGNQSTVKRIVVN